MHDVHVSRAAIAELLGLEQRQTFRLVKDGKLSDGTPFPSKVSGRSRTFPRLRCVQWYIRYKQEEALERAAARQAPQGLADTELRKALADAEIAELKVQRLRGEVVPVEEYRRELRRVLERIRARFAAMPGEYAPRILEPLDMVRATMTLREMVAAVLSELQSVGDGASDISDASEAEDAEGVA